MVVVVAELLQVKVLPPVTVSKMLWPSQMAAEGGEMEGERLALTVTVEEAVAEQLEASITVTE